jgi:NTP pyrophosphatase (non-canonical NTP hydrolase)
MVPLQLHRPGRLGDPVCPDNVEMSDSLDDLRADLASFAADRDWEQFHSPKNLASALIVEAAELLEHFQWLNEDESRRLSGPRHEAVRQEIGDVLLYLIQLGASLGIDPVAAARAKLAINAVKYPVEKARGHSRKYNET